MRRTLPILALAALLGLPAPVRGESAPNPASVVRQLINAVRGFKDGDPGSLSLADHEKNEEAKRLANQSLAIGTVARRALGRQWEKLGAAERADFVDLVRGLLETVAYPKSAGFFGDLVVEFSGEQVTEAGRAVVETVVRHPTEGLVAIDYKLEQQRSGWMIYDILLDQVSLAIDLRSQVQKVLREESYARLVERMREKLDEHREGS